MSLGDGLRQLKKERTREALVEAALSLFERRGFEATTVDELAEAAEVSRRTFFRYFATKEAVLFPDREARLDRFRALLAERRRGEPAFAAIRRACLALAREYGENRAVLLRQQRVIEASPSLLAFERELDRDWEEALSAALDEGSTRRARVLAGAVMGAVRAVLADWFARGATEDLVASGELALRWLEQGFGAEASEAPPLARE
jgi:AcrR family transcriptional regulator